MSTYAVLKSFEFPPRPRAPKVPFYIYERGSTQIFSEWPPAEREAIAARYVESGHIAPIASEAANPAAPEPVLVPPEVAPDAPSIEERPASTRLRRT